jgi:hypothetical protein
MQVANFPHANPNVRHSAPDFLTEITKERDFFDKLNYSEDRELFGLMKKLQDLKKSYGTVRTTLSELVDMRLTQLRRQLNLAQ